MPEITDKKTAWTGKFLKAVLIELRNSKGEKFIWEAFKRQNCDGIIAVVPFTKDGQVVVIKQFRPPVEKYVIEFPAGLSDRGESLIDVAHRELLEETGYSTPVMELLATGPLSAGASTEVLTVFVAVDAEKTSAQNLDHGEEIEIITLPVKDFYQNVYALENENTYIDLKLFGLFELAKKKYPV
ncbi:NUDIX hydrolase [Candidatus Magnetomonas plexicatena]|uniref:NUDIX hydrolase n=1 Tax=Candidatus Magnetomonas plexicatena TaxID=2552947 RepID=UPI001C7609B5|nr:NUDIX hydrolase [Nitrospirales bacterium LBB_01]